MEQQTDHTFDEKTESPITEDGVTPASDAAIGSGSSPTHTAGKTARAMLIRVTLSGVMVALSVIFCRLLGFPQEGIWRVEIGFLPIALIAFLWGPLWAGAAYGASDLIGAAIFTGINPFITVEKVLTGVIMGIFFSQRRGRRPRIGVVRSLIAFASIAVFLDFLMMVFIFHFGFGFGWGEAFAFRGVNAAVNLVLRVAVILICDHTMTERLMREVHKRGI